MTYCDPCPPPPCEPRPFKLECVIICDRYHDFLRHTLPHNKFIFDKLVVVTSPEDKETRRMCEFHHVECVVTDLLQSRWKKFCKGAGINEGLRKLSLCDWAIHLDADIWLPPQTRILLERANLNPHMIYGCDRFNVKGCRAWNEFLDAPKLQQEANTYIHLDAFPVGTRIMLDRGHGYIPIGFFQLWNAGASGIKAYPEGHTDAGREDCLFAMNWQRGLRGFLPEIVAYHLESEDAKMEANWAGRKTSPFKL